MPFRPLRTGALIAVIAAVLVPAAHAATTGSAPAPAATVVSDVPSSHGAGYTATLTHFLVHVGPGRATACDVVGELFAPTTSEPVPVILTTNGFGGSYKDQESMARYFAPRGYAVLTYSGLGFGGSRCAIELDDPDWDGAAASQLISWLGEQPEILKDGPDDPRVGMIGGSYGGGVQFSTAAVDPRLDTIVPIITWNDLGYSLAPNNNASDFVHTDAEPGVLKFEWATLFFADGLTQPFNLNPVPGPSTCPGFDPRICSSFLASAALGYPTGATLSFLRHASMVSFSQHVKLPVMLMQGEGDSLFNINEAVANYRALTANGDTVKLVIQSWGHSSSSPKPGEASYSPTGPGYETQLISDWFAKYLKHENVSTGPAVEYFRDWVAYDHHGSAGPAYGTASSWPVGGVEHLYLSGTGTIVDSAQAVTGGSRSFVNPPGGATGSYSETSALQPLPPFADIGALDLPGTATSWSTPALPADLDSVGVPQATVNLTTTSPAGVDPLLDPVIYAKLYDVAPDGSLQLVQRLVSPVRVQDESRPVTITLPGVVHRYLAGHRIELVLAATDAAYLGSRIPDVLTVSTSPTNPSTLSLPVVAASSETTGGQRATGAQ